MSKQQNKMPKLIYDLIVVWDTQYINSQMCKHTSNNDKYQREKVQQQKLLNSH